MCLPQTKPLRYRLFLMMRPIQTVIESACVSLRRQPPLPLVRRLPEGRQDQPRPRRLRQKLVSFGKPESSEVGFVGHLCDDTARRAKGRSWLSTHVDQDIHGEPRPNQWLSPSIVEGAICPSGNAARCQLQRERVFCRYFMIVSSDPAHRLECCRTIIPRTNILILTIRGFCELPLRGMRENSPRRLWDSVGRVKLFMLHN